MEINEQRTLRALADEIQRFTPILQKVEASLADLFAQRGIGFGFGEQVWNDVNEVHANCRAYIAKLLGKGN